MVKQATGTGKTVEEAMEAAKTMLGIKDGDDFEIIETVQMFVIKKNAILILIKSTA